MLCHFKPPVVLLSFGGKSLGYATSSPRDSFFFFIRGNLWQAPLASTRSSKRYLQENGKTSVYNKQLYEQRKKNETEDISFGKTWKNHTNEKSKEKNTGDGKCDLSIPHYNII